MAPMGSNLDAFLESRSLIFIELVLFRGLLGIKDMSIRVLHTECGLNWGGQELRTLLECQWLNNNGHTAWLMCNPGSEIFKRAGDYGVSSVVAIDLTRTWRLDTWLRVLWFVWRHDVDVINSHGPRDSIICVGAWLSGKPLLRSRQVTNPIKRTFSYRRCCTGIIATAGVIKAALVAKGVSEQKIAVISEGVDLEEYAPRGRPATLVDEFAIAGDEKVVINIGMIRADKGQAYYVEAAAQVLASGVKSRFFIIGDATRKQQVKSQLQERIATLGIGSHCHMVGYREDVADFINLADVVVIASTGTEAQSRIVPQSFASRTAVVSTTTGGLTELVVDRINGLLVPPADAGAIVEAVTVLLRDDALRGQLAEAGYRLASRELSLQQMMNKTVALYRRACAREPLNCTD